MIYIYFPQTVLPTNSSHIKTPSQVSLIDFLVFKQQKTILSIGHTQKKRFFGKEIYQKSLCGSDVPSETYPPPFPYPEKSRFYLTSFQPLLGTSFMNGH